MRIGLTIRSFYARYGGLQAHAEHLVRELQSRGHEVVILTRSVSHSPSYRDFFFFSESVSQTEVNGLPVTVLCHSQWLNPLLWVVSKCLGRPTLWNFGIGLVEWVFLRQTLTVFQTVDVIHHVGQADELIGFVAAAAARTLEVPFVVQPTAHPGQWGDSPFDQHLYQQADRLLVHTEYERESLKQMGLDTAFDVVGNGVEDRHGGDGDRFRRKHGIKGPMFLFLGRKSSDKGYPLVKAAFQQVHAQHPQASLVCIGPSTEESASTEAQEGVLELGFLPFEEKQDALAACTALCVPSEGESFGLVYMEAARYAKPSIARRLPVLEELLGQHGAALLLGIACGSGNQIDLQPVELSEAMMRVLNDAVHTTSIGQNAYRISEELLWSRVVLRFEAAYQRAISDFPSGTQPVLKSYLTSSPSN